MIRSLYSGVSGLSNHQLILDTTANNLANISTSGFKGSRVSFSTALMQTQSAGSSPTGSAGGLNPRQVGLGVRSSSVDVDTRQGALLTTGRTMDLAIQGNGFFRVVSANGTAAYTRVGNFGFDADNNLTDLGSGMMVQGHKLDSNGLPTGDRTNISLVSAQTIDSKVTTEITFQGNLNSATPALRGTALASVLPMTVLATSMAATNSTLLKDLTVFTGPVLEPAGPANTKTLNVYGTKPDGTVYAGKVTINPWQDTAQTLISKINSVLVQGSETIGSVTLENGNLKATGAASQDGFSLFLGEADPLGSATPGLPLGGGTPGTPGATANVNPLGASDNSALAAYVAGTTQVLAAGVVLSNEAGIVNPTFTVAATLPSSLNIKVKITEPAGTTREVGNIVAPALTGGTYKMPSLPHLMAGETLSYEINSTGAVAAGAVSWTTEIYADSNPANLLRDAYNGTSNIADGSPDLFQENSTADVNALQYTATNNSTMDWYKLRFVPDKVTSSVQVYDSVGGSHTIEATFFRTGTKSVITGSAETRSNSWDMVMSMPVKDGTIKEPLVVGIEFDEKGRYVGNSSLGKTVHGGTLSNPSIYPGSPGDNIIDVSWAATGDSAITLKLGTAASTDGLSGFGSASTATAIDQNGYASGTLDSLSVTNGGQVVGLYTNGKSLSLYELEIDTFLNPSGLTSSGGNLWQVSANSGDPLARSAGTGGAGTVTSGALEGSNVDIAGEFTRLITAQRGFQVNSRVIQTTDSILQELAGLIRG
jgi:flagellar hook protein FlgE